MYCAHCSRIPTLHLFTLIPINFISEIILCTYSLILSTSYFDDFLKDSFPSCSHMASDLHLLQEEDLECQVSTSISTSHLGGLLCIGFQYNLFTDIQMVSFHVWIQLTYSHGRIRTGFYGFWWRPWVYNLYNLSCARLCHAWWHVF